MGKVSAVPQFQVFGDTVDEMISFIVDSGAGVIGTVDDACEQIQRLVDQSGGFGCYMLLGHHWADPGGDAPVARTDGAPRHAGVPGLEPEHVARRRPRPGQARPAVQGPSKRRWPR